MRAVILAAGVGRRLGEHGDRPKCLLAFDGQSLLCRHLDRLADVGIDKVTMCVGYKEDEIAAHLRDLQRDDVELVANPDYREGSMVSLWTTRDALNSGDDIVLMDADVLYAEEIMRRLVSTPHRNRLLCDRDFDTGDEPVKICLLNNQIVEFRKQLDPGLEYNDCGESVGFFLYNAATAKRLASYANDFVVAGQRDLPYEEAIRRLLLESPNEFDVADVTGVPWLEIDFPEDIQRAQNEILPRLHDR